MSMSGKICLISGATAGIGEETALSLAAMGAEVIITARSEQKAARTLERARREVKHARLEVLYADFGDLAQVRSLAATVLERYPRLDVLINNAGSMYLRRQLSADGYELTFAVNHLAPFLLTRMLLPLLKSSAPARIVNVASSGHRRGPIDFDDLHSENDYRMMAVYGKSKLANMLFTRQLSGMLQGSSVTVNSLHPGLVRTEMAANNGWFVRLLLPLIHLRSLTSAEGAQTSIYLASSPEVEGISGKYFINSAPSRTSHFVRDEQAAERLWQVSEKLVDQALEAGDAALAGSSGG